MPMGHEQNMNQPSFSPVIFFDAVNNMIAFVCVHKDSLAITIWDFLPNLSFG